MQLKDLINNIQVIQKEGSLDKNVSGLQIDSRKVTKDNLFIATKGTIVDGHIFIEAAISNGASVIVCEDIPKETNPNTTYIQVEDSNRSIGFLADTFFDHPSSKLKLIGITGTNGKTTTATLLYDLFTKLGYKVGLLSTVCNYIHATSRDNTHNT